MSVIITLTVDIGHPSGAFQRVIEIHRLTQHVGTDAALRDDNEKNVYNVELKNSKHSPPKMISTFEHKYGDDVLTLVAEAIEALGGKENLQGARR